MGTIEFRYNLINDIQLVDYIELEFNIVNQSNKTIYFSRRDTPFDSYISDCFIIKENDEKPLQFDGVFVKRLTESEEDIITLESEKWLTVKFKISESYKFLHATKHVIVYNVSKFRYAYNKELLIKYTNFTKSNYEIKNEPCVITIKSNAAVMPVFRTLGDKNRKNEKHSIKSGLIINGGSPTQKSKIIDLTNELINLNNSKPLTVTNSPLYKKWFGNSFPSNGTTVRNNYTELFFEIGKQNMQYNILSKVDGTIVAETTKYGNSINIFSAFFALDQIGFDSQSGVLIHEFSHIICETVDSGNSISDSLDDAKNNPDEVISFANNYEYYYEDFYW